MADPSNQNDDAAAEVARRLRAGMDQRRAEVAALSEIRLGPGLLDLERSGYVEEPIPISARPLFGPLIVFTRKVVYHLFLKWYMRPVLQQQNSFNHAASKRIQELLERNRMLEKKLEEHSPRRGPGS